VPLYRFILLCSYFFMIAGIGFLSMLRAKTYKDEHDESELPTRIIGITCIVIAVTLFGVYWFWL
jgi:hypothetical protein